MTIGKPFQPGQSGNPGGRPKTKPFRDALKRVLDEAGKDDERLRLIAEALLGKAATGDVQAIKEIADRLDGKPAQAIVGGDDEDSPIKLIQKIERVIVDPKSKD